MLLTFQFHGALWTSLAFGERIENVCRSFQKAYQVYKPQSVDDLYRHFHISLRQASCFQPQGRQGCQ
jgi:hypothetical protein